MVLIDALYINDGGGKVLLEYLLNHIIQHNEVTWLLIDERLESPVLKLFKNVYISKGSEVQRRKFYRRRGDLFQNVLCFGNIPPTVRLKGEVYVYFHNLYYLNIPKTLPLSVQLKYKIKVAFLKLFKRNANKWLVQTSYIETQLSHLLRLPPSAVQICPFYPPLNTITINKKPNTFFYPSNATPHKNHLNLIKAFCDLHNSDSSVTLILTVDKSYTEVYSKITEAQNAGNNIINLGFIDRSILAKFYAESEYVIYPSLKESFGLGLVEGIEAGCKIIAADLPYSHAVCEPSLLFQPDNPDTILHAMNEALHTTLKPSVSLINNNINELIHLLFNNEYPK